MDQEFEDEIDRDLLENGPGEPPFIRLAKAEQQVREIAAANHRLEAALEEAREDGERLTWAWEYPEAFITARRTVPPNLTGRQQIDAYRVKP